MQLVQHLFLLRSDKVTLIWFMFQLLIYPVIPVTVQSQSLLSAQDNDWQERLNDLLVGLNSLLELTIEKDIHSLWWRLITCQELSHHAHCIMMILAFCMLCCSICRLCSIPEWVQDKFAEIVTTSLVWRKQRKHGSTCHQRIGCNASMDAVSANQVGIYWDY